MTKQRRMDVRAFLFGAVVFGMASVGCGSDSPGTKPVDANQDKAPQDGNTDNPVTPPDVALEALPQAALVVSPAELTVSEGDETGKTFTVSLSRPVPRTVTVTVASADHSIATARTDVLRFDPNSTDPQTVTVVGTADDDIVDNGTMINLTADQITPASVRVQVTDVDMQGLIVMPPSLTMTEGKTGQFSVRLRKRPSSSVIVALVASVPSKLSLGAASLTFAPGDYSIEQQVMLTAPNDMDAVDDKVNVSVSATGVTTIPVAVTIADKDKLNLDVNGFPTTIKEDAGPATFFVRLTLPPPGPITVTLTSSDPSKATVEPATLMFTPTSFDTDLPVQIKPVADLDTKNDPITVKLEAPGIESQTLALTVLDSNSQQIVVTPAMVNAMGHIPVDEGASTFVDVQLKFKPGAPVTVTAFPSDTSKIELNPTTLTFDDSDYDKPRRVTIKGLQDDDTTDDPVKITLTSSGASMLERTVDIKDDDTQAILLTYLGAPGDMSLQESGKAASTPNGAQIFVRLQFQPAAGKDVTVAVASSNAMKLTTSVASLTFTHENFRDNQHVDIASVHDDDDASDSIDVAFTSTGVAGKSVTVHVVDIDKQNFKIDPPARQVDEPMVAQPPPNPLPTVDATFTLGMILPITSAIHVNLVSEDTARVAVATGSESVTLTSAAPTATIHLTVNSDADAVDNVVKITVSDMANVIPSQIITVTIKDHDEMKLLVDLSGPIDPMHAGPSDPHYGPVDSLNRLLVNEGPEGGVGTTATFHVALSADPVRDATVSLIPSSGGVVNIDRTSLTFTAGSNGTWRTGYVVRVTGKHDGNLEDDPLTIRISGAVDLVGPEAVVNVIQKDGDVEELVLTTASLVVTEVAGDNHQKTLGISLAKQPPHFVTVNLALPASLLGSVVLSQTTLIFTTSNFADVQNVTVTAVADANTNPEEGDIIVSQSLNSLKNRTVHVTTTPDPAKKQEILVTDVATTSVCQSNSLAPPCVLIEESKQNMVAGDHSIKVKLKYPPHVELGQSGPVSETINFSLMNSSKVSLSPNPFSLTFTGNSGAGGWDTNQTALIVAVPDDDVSNETGSVVLTSTMIGSPWSAESQAIHVKVVDNDVVKIVAIPESTDPITESGSVVMTVNVSLANQPSDDFVVEIGNNNPDHATASAETMTFTKMNYSIPRSFTIAGKVDNDNDPDTVIITLSSHSAKSGPSQPITVMVTDDVAPPPPPAEAGAEAGGDDEGADGGAGN